MGLLPASFHSWMHCATAMARSFMDPPSTSIWFVWSIIMKSMPASVNSFKWNIISSLSPESYRPYVPSGSIGSYRMSQAFQRFLLLLFGSSGSNLYHTLYQMPMSALAGSTLIRFPSAGFSVTVPSSLPCCASLPLPAQPAIASSIIAANTAAIIFLRISVSAFLT